MQEYRHIKKSNVIRIKIQDFGLNSPNLQNSNEPKAILISNWMRDWIEENMKCGKIKCNMLMPSKAEFAYFLGVSEGTVQSAIRNLEDMGYVESKQRIGTVIKNINSQDKTMRKLTSKRECAIEAIKQYITSNKMKIGNILPSSRVMSSIIGYSGNTTRAAFDYLISEKIISRTGTCSADKVCRVASLNFDIDKTGSNSEIKTLVDKISVDLKNYVSDNLSVGQKIPPHYELANMLNVSIKTVHDALKVLIDEEILLARRGRYGTTVIRMPYESNNGDGIEKSIFAPAKDTAFYFYEKTQNAIKKMIAENYDVGSKLPSIMALSAELDLSPNTIRKAFHNLEKDGYIKFLRGRYGGTFVVDIPPTGEETFKWIAVNPQYTKILSN